MPMSKFQNIKERCIENLKSKNITTKQHFLPACYLRQFSYDGTKINALSLPSLKTFTPSPEKICFSYKGHLFDNEETRPDWIESFFHKEESLFGNLLDEIKGSKKLHSETKIKIASFLGMIHARSMFEKIDLDLYFNLFLFCRATNQKGPLLRINDLKEESLKDRKCLVPPKELRLRILIDKSRAWSKEFEKQNLKIVHLKRKAFISSDTPLCISRANHLKHGEFEFSFPLTPQIGLYSYPKNYRTRLFKTQNFHWRLINTRTATCAVNHVFFTSEQDLGFYGANTKKLGKNFLSEHSSIKDEIKNLNFVEYQLDKSESVEELYSQYKSFLKVTSMQENIARKVLGPLYDPVVL